MCGIIGFNWNDEKLMKSMLKKLEHRGPDSSGIYTDRDISLGMRRLKIIDLSKNADQPMCDERGRFWLAFNGEIYNFKELKKRLTRHSFKSESDTEVVLHLFEEFGPGCIKYLDGMFAFAIWDSEKKTLFLARDRLGIKPLYYHLKDGRLIFASEIKAFKDEIDKKIDTGVARTYFSTRYSFGDRTFFKDVRKLPPGHCMTVKDGIVKIKKYWNVTIPPQGDIKGRIDHDAISRSIMDSLSDSVEKSSVSDVPVGIFLSGGLDSTAITAFSRKQNPDAKIKTFCADFGDCEENESMYAEDVSDEFGTDHHNIPVACPDKKMISSIVHSLDEPLGDAASIPLSVISGAAAKKVKVVLSGDGSDELFLGYRRYERAMHIDTNRRIFSPVKDVISTATKISGNRRLKRLELNLAEDNIKILWRSWNWKSGFSRNFAEKEMRPSANARNDLDEENRFDKYRKQLLGKSVLDSAYLVDLKEWLPNDILHKTDAITMAHSIEARVPFLNKNMIDLASSIPNRYKIINGETKYLLKRSMLGTVPRHIIFRRKQGFTVPLKKWLNEGLKEQAIDIISGNESGNNSGFFKDEFYKKAISEISNSTIDYELFWKILFFEEWYRDNFNE